MKTPAGIYDLRPQGGCNKHHNIFNKNSGIFFPGVIEYFISIGGEQATLYTDVILKIIEEFTDGFLILDQDREIIFFNEVLLRITGWRSKDILGQREKFLQYLDLNGHERSERIIELPDLKGRPKSFKIASFAVKGENGDYDLLRIKPAGPEKEDKLIQENYDHLFTNIGDALLTVDLKGRILAANPAFYKLIEYDSESGPADLSTIYVYKEELEDKLIRLLEYDTIFNLETHLYTKNKIIKRVLDCSWVMRDEGGVVTGYTTQWKDISYIKSLESRLQISERSYSILFDTILSSIIIVDPFGIILNWNYTAEQLYGYTWEEASGKHYDEVFRKDKKRPSIEKIFALVEKNKGRYIEAEVPRPCKDKSIKYTYASYTVLKNSLDAVIAYSIMEKDLTERVRLEQKLKASFKQIKETQSATILGFATLTEYRDKNTGKHLKRIREYTRVLAATLKMKPKYMGYITDAYIEDLCLSSVLHDVGKVAIEDSILLKPGKLSPDEYNRIKDHASMGGDALRDVDKELAQESFLTIGKEIAYYHHERWDGKGYPEGKKGEEIPLSARIVSLADVYDALTSDRPYKKAISHEEAFKIISIERGTQFDPDMVDAFIQNQEVFRRIKMFNEFEENPETIDDLLGGEVESLPETRSG